MPPPPSPADPPWAHPALLLATVAGLGRLPVAPGTWGAAAGVPLALGLGWAASRLAGSLTAGPAPTAALEAGMVAALCLAGVPVCTRAAALLGERKDPAAIVLDETAAMAATLVIVPPAARTAAVLAAAFALFRVFDILKPFPCDRCERLPAGLGIMADDWVAAAYAAAVVALMRWQGWL